MDLWQAAAANNAQWCDLIARSHGLPTQTDPQAWTCQSRTPPFYPDAVTLVPSPPVPDLLARVDTSPGCSIKDSYGALDLGPSGFRILFEAEWIARPAAEPVTTSGPSWRRITELSSARPNAMDSSASATSECGSATAASSLRIHRGDSRSWRPGRVYFLTLLEPSRDDRTLALTARSASRIPP